MPPKYSGNTVHSIVWPECPYYLFLMGTISRANFLQLPFLQIEPRKKGRNYLFHLEYRFTFFVYEKAANKTASFHKGSPDQTFEKRQIRPSRKDRIRP